MEFETDPRVLSTDEVYAKFLACVRVEDPAAEADADRLDRGEGL